MQTHVALQILTDVALAPQQIVVPASTNKIPNSKNYHFSLAAQYAADILPFAIFFA
jgi:hypothetical protein